MKHFDDPNMGNGFYVESGDDFLTVQFLVDQTHIAVVESEMRYGYKHMFDSCLTVEAYNEIFPNDSYLYILGFHVNKKFRGKGIGGKTLRRYFEEYSKTELNNHPIVLLAVPEHNTISQTELISVYEHFGFQVLHENLMVLTPLDLSELEYVEEE